MTAAATAAGAATLPPGNARVNDEGRSQVRLFFAGAYGLVALLEAVFTFWVSYPADQRVYYAWRAAYWAIIDIVLWWTVVRVADATRGGRALAARPYVLAAIVASAASPFLHLLTRTWFFEPPPRGLPPAPALMIWWPVVIVGAWRIAVLTAAYYFRLRSSADDALLARARLDRALLSRKAVESQLRALQGKVDPNLLFETLDEIEQACEWDPGRADRMLERLIAFLRAALPDTDDEATTVAQEVSLADAFLALAHARNEGVDYAIECASASRAAAMAPMLLTPLVAQAVSALRDTGGRVSVRVEPAAAGLRITIAAEGAEASAVWQRSQDVAEVGKRLEDLYGDAATLAVGAEGTHNMHIVLQLPHEPAPRDHR